MLLHGRVVLHGVQTLNSQEDTYMGKSWIKNLTILRQAISSCHASPSLPSTLLHSRMHKLALGLTMWMSQGHCYACCR